MAWCHQAPSHYIDKVWSDDLVMQGSRASTVILLFDLSQNILASTPEELKLCLPYTTNTMAAAMQGTRAPSQYPIRRLIIKSLEVLKLRDFYLDLFDQSEIWQAPLQCCCGRSCQISKWSDNSSCQSHGFKSSRDLAIRQLTGYWDGVQGISSHGVDLVLLR